MNFLHFKKIFIVFILATLVGVGGMQVYSSWPKQVMVSLTEYNTRATGSALLYNVNVPFDDKEILARQVVLKRNQKNDPDVGKEELEFLEEYLAIGGASGRFHAVMDCLFSEAVQSGANTVNTNTQEQFAQSGGGQLAVQDVPEPQGCIIPGANLAAYAAKQEEHRKNYSLPASRCDTTLEATSYCKVSEVFLIEMNAYLFYLSQKMRNTDSFLTPETVKVDATLDTKLRIQAERIEEMQEEYEDTQSAVYIGLDVYRAFLRGYTDFVNFTGINQHLQTANQALSTVADHAEIAPKKFNGATVESCPQ